MLNKMYEQMVLIRYFENALEELFKEGVLFGTVHGCIGQEALAVGIVNALKEKDIVIGHHRSHGYFLAYSGDVEGLLAEIMGKDCGVVGGRGGSQHLYKNNFYTNGVQGSMVPVSVGMSLAEKIKKTDAIVACFMGDGTLGQGVVYESMNMASLWGLPVLFVVENNFYAMSTRVEEAVAGSIISRGRAFGIESEEITSNDITVIYQNSSRIISKIRQTGKPFFWVINTYRLCGHSKSDDCCYRSKEEEKEWRAKDPLIIAGNQIERQQREDIEERCRERIRLAIVNTKDKPSPSKEVVYDYLRRVPK